MCGVSVAPFGDAAASDVCSCTPWQESHDPPTSSGPSSRRDGKATEIQTPPQRPRRCSGVEHASGAGIVSLLPRYPGMPRRLRLDPDKCKMPDPQTVKVGPANTDLLSNTYT